MIRLLLLLVLLGYVRSQSINADGTPIDPAGAAGTIWTGTDSAGVKFYAGLNCHTSDTGADDITIDFRAFQPGFGLTTAANPYYNWTQCEATDTAMLTGASPMAQEAHASDCRAVVSGDKAQYFTFTQDLSEAAVVAGAAPPCGCTFVTATKVWTCSMRCSRWAGYDADLDQIFIYSCDQDDPSQTLVRLLDKPMVQVGLVPEEQITRRYSVGLDVIESLTVPTPSTAAVAAPVALGAPLWLRITLGILNPDDTRTMFDMNGLGPVCALPFACKAEQVATDHVEDAADADRIGDAVDIIDVNGCGTSTPVAQQLENLRAKYIKEPTDGAEAMMFSPNTFMVGAYEAVSFLGKNVQIPSAAASRKMLITCSLNYGFKVTAATGDLDCFGDGTGLMDDTGYPTCPGSSTKARRRRSTEPDPALNLPKTVSTVIEIQVGEKKEEKSTGFPKCIANTTFYALTGVLAVLLLVVLAIGGYLTLKLRRVLNDRDSENSMTGIPNKAYY